MDLNIYHRRSGERSPRKELRNKIFSEKNQRQDLSSSNTEAYYCMHHTVPGAGAGQHAAAFSSFCDGCIVKRLGDAALLLMAQTACDHCFFT
jgi:hypothetical protein